MTWTPEREARWAPVFPALQRISPARAAREAAGPEHQAEADANYEARCQEYYAAVRTAEAADLADQAREAGQ